MSVVIGYDMGLCALMVSDCRTTFYTDESCATVLKTEEKLKIEAGPLGFMSGTGFVRLLDAIHGRVADAEGQSLGELMAIIEEEVAAIVDDDDIAEEHRDHARNKTSLILTCDMPTEDGGAEPAVLLYHPALGRGFSRLQRGQPFALHPPFPDEDPDERPRSLALLDELQQQLRVPIAGCSDEEVWQIIASNFVQMAAAVQELSRHITSISPECQVGIHWNRTHLQLSDIVRPGEPLKWLTDEELEES